MPQRAGDREKVLISSTENKKTSESLKPACTHCSRGVTQTVNNALMKLISNTPLDQLQHTHTQHRSHTHTQHRSHTYDKLKSQFSQQLSFKLNHTTEVFLTLTNGNHDCKLIFFFFAKCVLRERNGWHDYVK